MAHNVAQRVTITGPAGAELRMTRDGSNPTPTSELYTDPVIIDRTTTLKVAAFGSPNEASDVATRALVIRVATPLITPNGGTFSEPILVEITSATQGAQVRYTTDGSDPTESSTLALGPIVVDSSVTIKAKAFGSPKDPSLVATASFALEASGIVYFGYSTLTTLNASQLKAISNAPEASNNRVTADFFGDYDFGASATASDYFYFWTPDTFSNPADTVGFNDPIGFGPISMAGSGQGFTQGPINGWYHTALTVDGVPGKLRRSFFPLGGSGQKFTVRVQ